MLAMRPFGRTGMRLSILGFGCGAVAGLMVRGDPLDQERTIAQALAAGVNYFDTAVQYGNGESEKNLGRILLQHAQSFCGRGATTKFPRTRSGSSERHPIASRPPEPIGSAMIYGADIVRARRLMPLVKEGFAASLTEAATRFAISHPAMGTILVGMATPQQFEDALAAVQKGPLPPAALDRLAALQRGFAGEPR